jgi:hypothetical protein
LKKGASRGAPTKNLVATSAFLANSPNMDIKKIDRLNMLTKLKKLFAKHQGLKKVTWFVVLYFFGLLLVGGAMWLSHVFVDALGYLSF